MSAGTKPDSLRHPQEPSPVGAALSNLLVRDFLRALLRHLLSGNPAVNLIIQHIERHRAAVEDLLMERAQIEAVTERSARLVAAR